MSHYTITYLPPPKTLLIAVPIDAKKTDIDTKVLVGSTSLPTDVVVDDKSAQPLLNGSCGI